MKTTLCFACAAAMAAAAARGEGAAPQFDMAERALLRTVAEEVQSKLKTAVQIGGRPVTILPVRGDRDAYLEQQLIGALLEAKLTPVVSNDSENDARFKRILKEISWDAAQTRLSSIDPSTVDELGRLKSTQILLEARLDVVKGVSKSGKATGLTAELNLLAYEIATKKYVWSATAVASSGQDGRPRAVVLLGLSSEQLPLVMDASVKPDGDGAAALADRLDTLVRGTLAELGFRLDAPDKADASLSVAVSKSVFDQSGGYFVFDGTAKAKASVAGAEPRLLGETAIDARGRRGLGAAQADRNLADAVFEQLSPWMKKALGKDAIGFEAVGFGIDLPAPVESAADFVPAVAIRDAAMAMDGVRSCVLVSQDDATGRVTFRAVYEKAKFPVGFLNALFTGNPQLEKALAK